MANSTLGMSPQETLRTLLEAGVHFGHQSKRWNPKMKPYIFTERNGIHVIDLQQTVPLLNEAYDFVTELTARGGKVLFVGTKKQAQEAIEQQAGRVGMPYVNNRWLGGMLTNFSTVHQRLERLKELEEMDFDDVAGSSLTKKELLTLSREKDKLERTLGGIRGMAKVPSAVWVVDTKKEHIAVKEARKLGIPVIAILDTNCDPDEVDYPVPGNDDAIRAVALLTRVVADAVADGLRTRAERAAAGSGDAEPLAEWETEVLGAAGATTAGDAADAAAPESASVEPVAADQTVADAAEVPADAVVADVVQESPAEAAEQAAAGAEEVVAAAAEEAVEQSAPEGEAATS